MGGFVSSYLPSFQKKPPPGTPVGGFPARLKNIVKCHHRGLIGIIFPIILFPLMFEMHKHDKTVEIMWWTLMWFFFFQPVTLPVAGFLPIFILPLFGVTPSAVIVKTYMNENIHLLILSSALILLLNNSGADRRLALWFICSGDNCQYSGKRLVLKFSTAGFFLGMLSNRIIASSTLIQYACPPLIDLQAATEKNRATEPNYNRIRNILISAIHTSCSIGSIAIIHSSPALIAFKAMFTEYPGKNKMYPDCFNYLQYSVYGFPTAFVLLVLNFTYHMVLINQDQKMSASSMTQLQTAYLKYKEKIPKRMTLHEKYSVLFTIIYLLVFFLRWSRFLNMGWADFSKYTAGGSVDVPACKDATVAAIFMAVLHILPKSFDFLKVLGAEKRSDLPPLKMESSILWWRFVDKNINYSFMFLIGTGIALTMSARDTGLGYTIKENLGRKITDNSLNTGLFIICLLTTILTNIMTGLGACVLFLPFVLCATGSESNPPPLFLREGEEEGETPLEVAPDIYGPKQYLCALAVGVASSLSFMIPVINNPSYFARSVGKLKRTVMAKYGLGSSIISVLVIWVSLVVWAPIVWDPDQKGISMVPEPFEGMMKTATTTAAPEAGAPEEAPEGLL